MGGHEVTREMPGEWTQSSTRGLAMPAWFELEPLEVMTPRCEGGVADLVLECQGSTG